MAPIRVTVRQTTDMYAENVQYLSSSAFTFEFEHGFCAGQLPLDFEQGCFTIITKGDRNLEWETAECGDDKWHELFRLPYFTCHCIGPRHSWTMRQIIDRGLLTWEECGESGPFLTVILTEDFNAILSREFSWRTLRSMVAWLRSLLPQFLGGTDEPVEEFVPSLAKDDRFIQYTQGNDRCATASQCYHKQELLLKGRSSH